MPRRRTLTDADLALGAYRLGYLSIALPVRGELRWDLAQRGENLPGEISQVVADLRAAGAALYGSVHAHARDILVANLEQAVSSAWDGLQRAWMGRLHRGRIRLTDHGESELLSPRGSPFARRAWGEFQVRVDQFCNS